MVTYTAIGLPKVVRPPIPPQLAEFAATNKTKGLASFATSQVVSAPSQEVGGDRLSPSEAEAVGRHAVTLSIISERPEWQDKALCSQYDPETFFPERGESGREAKRICFRCEVRNECLEYALGTGEPFGIWGGLSERERRGIRRRPA